MANFKRAIGGALSSCLAKYVAKPGVGLDAWPARTRWAQTIIAVVPRQVPRVTPESRGWLVSRVSRFASQRTVLARFDALIRRLDAPPPAGVANQRKDRFPLVKKHTNNRIQPCF